MTQRIFVKSIFIIFALIFATGLLTAQSTNNLAAVMEVLSGVVEVKRVDTSNWIPVNVEAIVGVGDVIRTDETGSARITYFADGVSTDILPDTEYEISEFHGESSEDYVLRAKVLVGNTIQRLGQLLDAQANYTVDTPGASLAARGTEFSIRVEEGTFRSAMIVSEGLVEAGKTEDEAEVPAGFGVRAPVGGELSDVVQATSFAELDAALDGCPATIGNMVDDVRLNVRLGPDLDNPRVGTIDPSEITQFYGINESGGWYRIIFAGNFGWIMSSSAEIGSDCAGLRVFPDTYTEDPALYETLGENIELEDLVVPTPIPEEAPADDADAESDA